jgi:hypothetical protein
LISVSNQHLANSITAGNLIYDMTDLYKNNMTAYSAQFDAAEKNLQAFLNTDKVYAVPITVSSQPPTSPNTDGTNPQFGSYMRLDYYQGVGAPAINSLDDLLNVLQQMQQKYPTSDSGKPTYAFSLFADWDGGGMWWANQICYQFGMTRFGSNISYYDPSNGQLQSVLDDNGYYKQTLEMLFKANQLGLVDPDSQTQDFNTLTGDKYGDGAVLYSPVSWMGVPTYNSDANLSAGKGYAFIPVGGSSKIYADGNSPYGTGSAVAIGQGAKDPARLADFLNWMTSPMGFMTCYDGPQGLAWDLDSQGQPYLTELGVPALQGGLGGSPGPDVPAQYGGGQFTTGSPIGNPGIGFSMLLTWRGTEMNPILNCPYDSRLWTSTLTNNATALDKLWQTQFGTTDPISYLNAHNQIVVASPSGYSVPPLSTDLNTVSQSISQELINDSWQMVWAKDQADFDSIWQNMATTCNGLGFDDLFANDQKDAGDLYAAQQKFISDYNAAH